jgi:hypothetical protein
MGSLSGRCLCGAISYDCDAEPAMTLMCHCDDCQRTSGAGFSVNVVVPTDALTVTGEPSVYETTGTDSGQARGRQFCSTCGSTLFTTLGDMPQLIVIKAGTLDDRSAVRPQMEIWTDSAQPWINEDAERRTFARDLAL